MKLVYSEWYGELSYAQRAAYRKYNVTPVEHRDLVDKFGADAHARITDYIVAHALTGSYRAP